MWSGNSSLLEAVLLGYPACTAWANGTEGALYHLGNTLLWLGYMGGSGAYGALYIFSCMVPAFLCHALWGWQLACGAVPVVAWSGLLGALCLLQIAHLLYRLQQNRLPGEEFRSLFTGVYLPLGVPVSVFKEVAAACDSQVLSLSEEESYALEGKTPIDRLSFLLSGRIRVSLEGQFLHYIFPYQFLDSPEWESLRPTEEGNFQVTLTAETDCRYISWRRRKLYALLSRDRYVARLFSVMLGSDIADKLYSLNDKLFARSNVRLDIRLPSLYHVLAPPSAERSSAHQTPPPVNPKPQSRPSETERPSGEDSTSLVLEDFADMTGSFMEYSWGFDYVMPPTQRTASWDAPPIVHREDAHLWPPLTHLVCDEEWISGWRDVHEHSRLSDSAGGVYPPDSELHLDLH